MSADRIRVAEPAPPHCSSCFQQKPDVRHIDFGASWDGPMLKALDGAVGVVGHSIDELIICSDCLRIAAGLIGLVDAGQLEAMASLELANAQLHQRTEQLEAHVASLEAAGRTREAIAGPPITALMPHAARPRPTRSAGPRRQPSQTAKRTPKPKGQRTAKKARG